MKEQELNEILKSMDGKTNYCKVLKYMMEHGSITSFEAFEKLHNTRLSASIFILRTQYGIPIGMDVEISENNKRYGRYYINREDKNEH